MSASKVELVNVTDALQRLLQRLTDVGQGLTPETEALAHKMALATEDHSPREVLGAAGAMLICLGILLAADERKALPLDPSPQAEQLRQMEFSLTHLMALPPDETFVILGKGLLNMFTLAGATAVELEAELQRHGLLSTAASIIN